MCDVQCAMCDVKEGTWDEGIEASGIGRAGDPREGLRRFSANPGGGRRCGRGARRR